MSLRDEPIGSAWQSKSHESKIDCHDFAYAKSRNDNDLRESKKRILITLKDITERGGGERVGANLANAFSQNLGFCVQIVSFFRVNTTPCYALDSAVKCTYLCNAKAKSKNPLISLLNKTILRVILCLKTHKIARQTNADIVLANDGWFVPLFRDKTRNSAKFIRLWHINAPKRARKKLRLFDTMVVLSSREIALWQQYHKSVKVIPNFIPHIPSKSTNHAQKIVLSVGRMDKGDQKGFLRLIDIWKIVQDRIKLPHPKSLPQGEGLSLDSLSLASGVSQSPLPCEKSLSYSPSLAEGARGRVKTSNIQNQNPPPVSPLVLREGESVDSINLSKWKLIIVGDGILKPEIESKIKALNLQDSIILKPFTKDIESEYLSASVYAMSSLWEGFGMVLAEASSYALPCIAFDIATGPSDIIEHNVSGFLINDNDLEAYANHLMLLMSDKSMRIRFGSEAKRIVGERFAKSVVLEKWQRLFNESIKR